MNKKIISVAIFTGMFFLATSSLAAEAVKITNYGPDDFCALFKGVFNAIAGLIGAVGTIMIIVAGIFYLTSAGSQERMTKAKTTLIYAIVGIAIALAAGAIIEIITSILSANGAGCEVT